MLERLRVTDVNSGECLLVRVKVWIHYVVVTTGEFKDDLQHWLASYDGLLSKDFGYLAYIISVILEHKVVYVCVIILY